MSLNKVPQNLTSVEKLVQRLHTAEKSNQKEIRLSTQEARDILTDLSIMTAKIGKNLDEINAKLDKINVASSEIKVQVDGGTF
jgi:septation ring formation regulator EzrA